VGLVTAADDLPSTAGSLRDARLLAEDQAALLSAQSQCVLSFHDPAGWPRAVVLSYIYARERFWLTAVSGRPHVEGLRADPRVTVVVSNLGTPTPGRQMLAQRGMVTLHTDRPTLDWFFPCFAQRHEPQTPESFARHLDTANRVVIEVAPVGRPTSHDSRRLSGDGRGRPAGS
jgi:hypothetical protein